MRFTKLAVSTALLLISIDFVRSNIRFYSTPTTDIATMHELAGRVANGGTLLAITVALLVLLNTNRKVSNV